MKRTRKTPDEEAAYWCRAGLDKEGFMLKYISDYKGYGVFSTQHHQKGDFMLEYVGESLTMEEAKEREKKQHENMMFFFKYGGKDHCIDASSTQGHICQFVNDGDKHEINCIMKIKEVNHRPGLCLYASKNILPGEELMYDYGDIKKNLWWRKEAASHDFEDYGDDDPFDVDKISDYSSSDESFVSDSSLSSEVVALSSDITSKEKRRKAETEVVSVEEKSALEVHERDCEAETEVVSVEEKSALEVHERDCEAGTETEVVSVEEKSALDGHERDCEADTETEVVSVEEKSALEVHERDCEADTETEVVSVEEKSALEVHERDCERSHDTPNVSQDIQDSLKSKPVKKERPKRMCIYCEKLIAGGKLKRHMKTHKSTNAEVSAMLKKSKSEQEKWFVQKRREGMYTYNTKNLDTLTNEQLMRERKPKAKDQVRMCDECKCFISNRTFYKHRKNCLNGEAIKTQAIKPLEVHKDPDFVKDILNNFRDGEVGDFIRQDKTVQLIGYKHYCSRKVEKSKTKEVKREIMMEMRELTRLFLCFQELSGAICEFQDMYKRTNISLLVDAFNKLCALETADGEKSGLKVNLNGVFLKSIKTLKNYYSGTCNDRLRKEMKLFKEAYVDRSPEFMSKAKYNTNKNSLKKARLPKNLPKMQDLSILKHFIQGEITHLVDNFSLSDYAWLRSLIVARLTLYNARRGEEGSRILIEEWDDAMCDVWVPPESIERIQDPAEKYLVGQYKLVFMAGKGRKLVPVLIPIDLIPAVKILLAYREKCGIPPENPFLFATKSAKFSCSGWHAVSDVCNAAGVSVNATRNRHLASTFFASLDMTELDRQVFFDHMGHAETINKENYQCPPGLRTVRVMGNILQNLEGNSSAGKSQSSSCGRNQEIETPSNETAEQEQSDELPSTLEESNLADAPYKKKKSSTQTNGRTGSFRWSQERTDKIRKDFQKWINTQHGNSLPRKGELEVYLQDCDIGCTYLQLRTKLMNEQNKRRKLVEKKMKELQC